MSVKWGRGLPKNPSNSTCARRRSTLLRQWGRRRGRIKRAARWNRRRKKKKGLASIWKSSAPFLRPGQKNGREQRSNFCSARERWRRVVHEDTDSTRQKRSAKEEWGRWTRAVGIVKNNPTEDPPCGSCKHEHEHESTSTAKRVWQGSRASANRWSRRGFAR